MTPVFMLPREERRVREIYKVCHPSWPDRPTDWFVAHPTLVLHHEKIVVGFTSFSLSIAPTPTLASYGDDCCYGHDVCVSPTRQGKGYGRVLADGRLAMARHFGVKMFLGMTQETNVPMVRIFEAQGCTRYATIPGAFPHDSPSDGIVYVKALR